MINYEKTTVRVGEFVLDDTEQMIVLRDKLNEAIKEREKMESFLAGVDIEQKLVEYLDKYETIKMVAVGEDNIKKEIFLKKGDVVLITAE